jgi:hypothetical protein
MWRMAPRDFGRLLLAAAISSGGCATAEDTELSFAFDSGTGRPDSAVTTEDTTVPDSGATEDTLSPADSAAPETATTPDSATSDTAVIDTSVPDTAMPDTAVMDTAMPDTAVMDTAMPDSGVSPGKVLIFDDTAATLAGAAVTALGGTPTVTATGPAFNAAFDAGGINIVVIDCALNPLPAGVITRVTTWAATGRVVFAYWDLDAEAGLRTALKIASTASYSSFKPIHNDPTSTVNLFTFKQTLTSPQTKTGFDELADNGDSLTVAAGGFLAARHDSATGTGAIAVTNSGKIVVNGFAPYNIRTNDLDTDGIKDMQELYENEIAYVSTK